MTDPIHEQLSAFHDGELAAAETELLLKRLERDPQLRATVGRYALMGEAMRSAEAGGPSRNFAERVAKAIEREDAPSQRWRPIANWLKPIAGGAIAAGVAAVALVSLRVATPTGPRTEELTVRTVPPAAQIASERIESKPESLPSYTVPVTTNTRNAPPIQIVNNGRLANFVMAHSEYSLPLGQRNVLTGLLVDDPVEQSDATPDQDSPSR